MSPDPPADRFSAEPLVIFDCDGVLVDSEIIATRIEAELLATIGVTMTVAEVGRAFIGLDDDEMHRRIRRDWGVEVPPAFAEAKAGRIDRALAEELEAIAGIDDLLGRLDAARCVASSSSPARIRTSLSRTGLDHHFGAHVFSASMVRRGKPAPDLFLHAAATMGARPGACVVVEDSPHGVSAGVAAGMAVLGFTAASHADDELADRLRGAGARSVVDGAASLEVVLHELLSQLRAAAGPPAPSPAVPNG